ncbi:MAG: hypothetical protein R3B97_10435 [Dehalococcoidia bacterium]|nr:hypothetical protein [Dehalococcoidia bacterium]MCB9484942.1 hypothetical protein [Thermoflexaceae bacterium]
MNKRLLAGALVAGTALLALPVSVMAQLPPSPPSALFYGSVQGASTGQGVVAIVINGNRSTTCGVSKVVDSGGPVFALDLLADGQVPGCGSSGRTVQFYITPSSSGPGRMATESATVPSSFQAVARNLTPGAPLTIKRIGVQVANDGIPGQ